MGWFGVDRGCSGSLEIATFDTVQNGFLLAWHCNYVPILHCFRDIAILVENCQF